jgi:hypothetical protein
MLRRRPLLRAAAVGGAGYMAGKRRAQRADAGSGYGAQAAAPADQGNGQPAQPQQATEPSMSDQLAQLSNLHAQGALSDAEFAAAKQRLLGS